MDSDYYFYQLGCLKLIFSKERISHILEVRQYLREIGASELQPNIDKNQTSEAVLALEQTKNIYTPRLKQPLANRRISDSSTRTINTRKK